MPRLHRNKPPRTRQASPAPDERAASRPRRKLVLRLLVAAAGVCLLGGSGTGLYFLEQQVLADDRFTLPPDLRLVNTPEELRPEIMNSLAGLRHVRWSDPTLPRRIGAALEANPWVKRVVRVRTHPDRTVSVECEYRTPAAMVQVDSMFYLVSADQVRLPGTYRYTPRMIVIQGAATLPPAPGRRWDAPDLAAGRALAGVLESEAFAGQITAVLVHNFGGRQNGREAHLSLATDRPGGRIIWGSAPGQEMEENTVARKLAILRDNFRRFGRADANHAVIDVSVYPDRFTTPA